jgi:glucose/arabinose dehydrogenase
MGRRLLLSLAAAALLAACGDDDEPSQGAQPQPAEQEPKERKPKPEREGPVRNDGGPKLETVATGLEAPWEIGFLPDGSALITERPGRVRLLTKGMKLKDEPVAQVEVAEVGEGGLMGLAVDPDFERNRFVYLYRTTPSGNEVVRYRFAGGRLRQDAVIADGIEAAAIHDGGRIHFGPDGRLYFSTGDAADQSLPQDASSLNGKILRMGPRDFRGDGGRPEVFTTGHRNPQGFDWLPDDDRFVSSEHGPEGDDEVNVLRKGGNYGWPDIQGDQEEEGFVSPVAVYEESIAPSGGSFVSLPGSEWTGDFLFGALVGEHIRRVGFEGDEVKTDEALFEGELGRVRTVVEGPDGALYVLTSNRDGRGAPREGDDRLVRIVPPAG